MTVFIVCSSSYHGDIELTKYNATFFVFLALFEPVNLRFFSYLLNLMFETDPS